MGLGIPGSVHVQRIAQQLRNDLHDARTPGAVPSGNSGAVVVQQIHVWMHFIK